MSVVDQVFEVRCERCNVSFPVGTKVCIHCGHRIDPHATTATHIQLAGADEPSFEGGGARPIDVMADPFESEGPGADESPSVGRTLIRSLGGLVWVIVLIGFTLARSCGGE